LVEASEDFVLLFGILAILLDIGLLLRIAGMAPSLRISAGPSVDKLTVLHVNDETKPWEISTDDFEGRIIVRIKGFTGELPSNETARSDDTHYFDHSYAKGCTWSIGVQGRLKKAVDVDDVEFGNLFEKPIRDKLPWGTTAALTAISYLDPNLRHDVYADKPWAFSPLICTMSRVNIQRLAKENQERREKWPSFPHGKDEDDYVIEDTSALICKDGGDLDPKLEKEGFIDLGTITQLRDNATAPKNRGRVWGNKSLRQSVQFTPQDVITTDFCLGFIRFSDLHLAIAGMSFDLVHYHDGQPVRFVARNKHTEQIYFVVEFQIVAKEA
jgi:hypothetical protein